MSTPSMVKTSLKLNLTQCSPKGPSQRSPKTKAATSRRRPPAIRKSYHLVAASSAGRRQLRKRFGTVTKVRGEQSELKVWSAATSPRFQSADKSAHSKWKMSQNDLQYEVSRVSRTQSHSKR